MLMPESAMLIVIDIQKNLYKAMHNKGYLLLNLQKIIKGSQVLGIPMIVTEQIPGKLGPTIPEIAPLIGDVQPIPKASFSCCGEEAFMEELKRINRKRILICGIETHVCVYQTAMDLLKLGYEVQVVTDCVDSRTAENRTLGIKRLKQEGAKVTSAEMALFELTKVAGTDLFREMVKIVK